MAYTSAVILDNTTELSAWSKHNENTFTLLNYVHYFIYICFVESVYPVLDHIQTAFLKCSQAHAVDVLSLCICKYLCILRKQPHKAIPWKSLGHSHAS